VRLLCIVMCTAVSLLAGAGRATASLRFAPCAGTPDFECATLTVPLDPAEPAGTSTRVAVRRAVETRDAPEVMVALGGGPGQSSTRFVEDFTDVLAEALENRQLVVLDQRGTGDSGALRCSALDDAPAALDLAALSERVGRCGIELGAARARYTTTEVVEDLEALRRELGVAKLSLFGVSYGAYVAQRYARRYPGAVDRRVVDSPVPQDQGGAYDLASYAAVARMLRRTCTGGACRGVTDDPVADVRRLAARLRERPLRGTVFDGQGRPRALTLASEAKLFDLFVSSDFSAPLRAALPAAVHAAVRGDAAPLLRLVAIDTGAADPHAFDEDNEDPTEFSNALFFTTTCEEKPRGEAVAPQRSAFAPFGPAAAGSTQVGSAFCRAWPATTVAPPPAPGLITAPALILSGARDIRTPTAGAVAVARWIAEAALVIAPDAGHSLVSSRFPCVSEALTRFFAGAAVGNPCAAGAAPDTAADVEPLAPRPSARHSLAALLDTVADAARIVAAHGRLDAPLAFGGLRGGSACARPGDLDAAGRREAALTFAGFAYVPGVRVSGRARVSGGTLRDLSITTAGARLRLRGDRLVGRLGGRAVVARVDRRVPAVSVDAAPVSSGRRCR